MSGRMFSMVGATLHRYFVWFQGGLLVMLGLVAFWSSMSFEFVNWDDPAYVEHNDLTQF